MTITQKIISENEIADLDFFDIEKDALVPPFVFAQNEQVFGAGALVCVCVNDKAFAKKAPKAVRIQLDGAPKDDFDLKDVISEILCAINGYDDILSKSVEIGGDSLSFLYVNERYEIAKALFGKCANCIFEADYLTVEYLTKRGSKNIPAVFADGEWDYERVFTVDLGKKSV